MKIRYDVKVSIANKNTGTCSSFPAKTFETEITAATDTLLYDNHHIIAEDVYLFDLFKDEVDVYSNALGVPVTELEFDSFEVTALAPPEQYQVYFDFDSDEQKQNLRPTIKVYIAPKESRLSKPTLKGAALDKSSILWTWDDDYCAHYLVTEAIDPANPDDSDKIIAQLPIGVNEYLETPLDPGTAYTRRLISYTATQYSEVSTACTIWTETSSPDIILNEYETPRLYDFTITEEDREVITERMKAFHSGVGDFTDLKVYKQMDADFYQKFKAYFEITGRRIQRERRYDQVGFWYKVCLDAMERVEEQIGEVTFDIYAYPREWLRLDDYVWATQPVTVKASFECVVFLNNKEEQEFDHPITVYTPELEEVVVTEEEPIYETETTEVQFGQPTAVIIALDMSTSMCARLSSDSTNPNYTRYRIHTVGEAAKQFIQTTNQSILNDKAKYDKIEYNGGTLGDLVHPATGKTELVKYIIYFWAGKSSDEANITVDTGAVIAATTDYTVAMAAIDVAINWHKNHRNYGFGASVETKKDIDGNTVYLGKATNFYEGLMFCVSDKVKKHLKSAVTGVDLEVFALLFFTDGFANIGKDNNTTYYIQPANSDSTNYNYQGILFPQIQTALSTVHNSPVGPKGEKLNIYFIFGNGAYHIDGLYINNAGQIFEASIQDDSYNRTAYPTLDAIKAEYNKKNARGDLIYKPTSYADANYTPGHRVEWGVFLSEMIPKESSLTGYYVPPPWSNCSNFNPSALAEIFVNALKALVDSSSTSRQVQVGTQTVEKDRYMKFKEWKHSADHIESTSKFDLDSIKPVKIVSDEYSFVFDNSITPVRYARNEKRAIIPEASFLKPTVILDDNGQPVNILRVIDEKVKASGEWIDGQSDYVRTNTGRILVKNLFIKDNYSIGDDDVGYTSGWEPGMDGSVNVFTDVDKGASSSYGDDCYLVDSNSCLKIQGFTEAIIFDGAHAVSAELNAYDYPQVTAIHSNGSVVVDNNTDIPCSSFMFNRKEKTKQYTGNGPYSHCVDIVECDRDIILQGLDNLQVESPSDEDEGGTGQNIIQRRQQKYQVFDPMTIDIAGLIELWYRSPVLNYRFNIEDPDARTSIYEILPDCNPDDNFLHVVLLHVYYARNVYINDGPDPEMLTGQPQRTFNYVDEYGDDPIAYYNDPNLLDDDPGSAEGKYKWTQKMWQTNGMYDNGWYLDDFVWFMAEKMMLDRPYHDEIPGHGMQPMYGLVNGRYTSKSQDGKQNLLVQVPQFNIPTTVQDYYIHYGGSRTPINWNGDGEHPLKIYIVLTEFHPKDALVGYKWEKDCQWVNPETGKVSDDITQDYKGCYATFSSDSVSYKDIEYYDLVETINFENQEVFDTKNNIIHYQLTKPGTEYEYTNYYLKITTDNSDVLALSYPTEIMFDEEGHADFGVTYKGVVNATTMWSPRIHNGYYYLNQHEYFAYSEFDFDHQRTRVEHNDLERCITTFGHMTFDVTLCRKAAPPEIYRGNNAVTKDNRSSLLQNENEFQWVDGKGVTLKPSIDGEYYKEYSTYMYYSPVISFPNTLTVHGPIYLDYFIEDGTTELMGVEIRSYILEDGEWSEWYPLAGVQVPCYPNTPYAMPTDLPFSHAYQVRFYLQASVKEEPKDIEDYLCCYLDWKDDSEESACYNIVTITDHITTGPYHGKGVFASKVFDFGCRTSMYLDIFQSNYKDKIKLYVATGVTKDDLYMENAAWQDISNGGTVEGRYMRYKIEIPEGEKLYWLHKKITTVETEAVLPYVRGFTMEGEYHPTDVITNFINTEAFEILADGTYQTLNEFSDLTKIIGDDVLDRGFTMDEIKKVDIRCTTDNVHILYSSNLLNEYPGSALKDTQLRAMTPLQTTVDINYTPYIFLDDDDTGSDKITVYGATPQQYCPITVEDTQGIPYIQLHECTDFEQQMKIVCNDKTKYIELPTNRYDILTMKIKVNGVQLPDTDYKIVNHIIIFNDFVNVGDTIEVTYYIMYSFIAEVDRYGDNVTPPNTVIYLYTGHELDENGEVQYIQPDTKYKVFFETGLRNNKFTANKLSLNPIYRTDYKGFIYLTDDNNEPYTVKIYCNPLRIKAGGYDRVDVAVEVLDILGNPVINREVYIDCGAANDDPNSFDRGIINYDNNLTDMNGVVHFVYESSILPVEAKIRASVFNCAGASIEDSIIIVNE